MVICEHSGINWGSTAAGRWTLKTDGGKDGDMAVKWDYQEVSGNSSAAAFKAKEKP